MAYQANIPAATDVISQSQSAIQGNFQALAPFGNGYADFTVQGATPPIIAADTGLYTKSNATTTQNEMYIQKRTNNADVQIPMTASSISNAAPVVNMVGWSYLPSGLLIKWGNYDTTTRNAVIYVNVDSISGGPAFNKIFNVQVTAYKSTTTDAISAAVLSPINLWTGTSIGMYLNSAVVLGAGAGIQYLVIGV